MGSLEQVRRAFAQSYAVEREVGQGGMATVYLARDLKHARPVALKVLRPELASAMGGDRFPREIQIIAQLAHPHILPLHDSGEIGGFLFYVMPFVEGESLRQKLTRDGPLPVREAIAILREVADALSYAHERGIIHRDIKPDNVMLSGRHAVVTDFGVAKAVSAATTGDTLTTIGVALGTPSYMSPEQAMGETDLDRRSDIYSLGAMAFEMLTGEPPFGRPTAQAVLSAHVLEAPPDVTTRRSDIPPALVEFIKRCLAKEKFARWQTAEEMLPVLESALTPSGGILPTMTRPEKAVAHPAKKPAAASRRMIIGAAMAAVAAVGAFGAWKALGAADAPGPNRMAILPIMDVSGADGPLVTAMQNQLMVSLGRIPGVTVAPASAMEVYKASPKPVAEMARELRVGAVLEGNVFRAGQKLRLTLQLTNPRTIEQVWSDSYDIDLSKDLFDEIDKVIPRISDGIRQRIGGTR